jgi:hypothetical protein
MVNTVLDILWGVVPAWTAGRLDLMPVTLCAQTGIQHQTLIIVTGATIRLNQMNLFPEHTLETEMTNPRPFPRYYEYFLELAKKYDLTFPEGRALYACNRVTNGAWWRRWVDAGVALRVPPRDDPDAQNTPAPRGAPVTDAEVIAAIRTNHLRANIGQFEDDPNSVVHWDEAWIDPGGGVFGLGPYLKVPVSSPLCLDGAKLPHRVYPPARLQRKLARAWTGGRDASR